MSQDVIKIIAAKDCNRVGKPALSFCMPQMSILNVSRPLGLVSLLKMSLNSFHPLLWTFWAGVNAVGHWILAWTKASELTKFLGVNTPNGCLNLMSTVNE